jgi:hypothetical protein
MERSLNIADLFCDFSDNMQLRIVILNRRCNRNFKKFDLYERYMQERGGKEREE